MITPAPNSIFIALNHEQLEQLFASAELITLKKDDLLIQEGNTEKSFYYLVEGSVKIYKHSGHQEHILATLDKGETVGELVLIDDAPRSTSVSCLEDSKFYKFDAIKLKNDPTFAPLLPVLTTKIGQQLSNRLRGTNEVAVAALKNKFLLSIFSIRIFILLALYALSLNLIEKSKQYFSSTTLLSLGLIIVFGTVMLSIIRQSGEPMKFYGFTWDNWRRNLLEGIGYSLPIMALILLIKWIVISNITTLHHIDLFDPDAGFYQGMVYSSKVYIVSMLLYMLFCPIQEIIVRGCVQTSLQNLLEGTPNRVKWKAILVSNLIFASAHSHTSLGFALSSFIPGLFWGWLFYRQKSLVGVSVSHLLIGVWAVFIVGFENII